MPPARGRSKKGLKRIDAAIDALVPMGFPKDVICRTVGNLLDVYGGDWKFIEEAAYKLLIDTILDDQVAEEQALVEQEREEDERDATDGPAALEAPGQVAEHGEPSSHFPVLAGPPCCDVSIGWKDISCTDPLVVRPSQSDLPSVPPKPRRKPCYGWISETESEDEEEVKAVVGLTRERKRASGWDVRVSEYCGV